MDPTFLLVRFDTLFFLFVFINIFCPQQQISICLSSYFWFFLFFSLDSSDFTKLMKDSGHKMFLLHSSKANLNKKSYAADLINLPRVSTFDSDDFDSSCKLAPSIFSIF